MQFQGIALSASVVTPSDSTGIGQTIGLFVGGAGNVNVEMSDGTDCLFTGVLAGQILPISVTKVNSTSTTATNIVALYYR